MPGSVVPLAIFSSWEWYFRHENGILSQLEKKLCAQVDKFFSSYRSALMRAVPVLQWLLQSFQCTLLFKQNVCSKARTKSNSTKKNLLILLNLLTSLFYGKNNNWLHLPLFGLIGWASVEVSCPQFQQYWSSKTLLHHRSWRGCWVKKTPPAPPINISRTIIG